MADSETALRAVIPDSRSILRRGSTRIYAGIAAQIGRCRSHLSEMIALFPKNLSYYHALATLHEQENRLDEASRVCREALSVNPKDVSARENW